MNSTSAGKTIMAGFDREVRDLAGQFVGSVHARRAAEGVARELIQKQAERQRAMRGVQQARKLLTRRGLVQSQKAIAKAPIVEDAGIAWLFEAVVRAARVPRPTGAKRA